ncbi:MAG: TIGR04348 family glycosyltransferase [Polaromonas sp.]|uniref:selenoneine biosynthesis selenosugar synthase SenB n=1 Tax=Polaromonas sp. TaxID=1869339 RepID=UPI0017FB2CD8|nr:selenoneine biosynthesis selenosugar synthase SenB [Polaromonas sp.]NMM10905.1 TIGR04348 family glycosyltransferase [Polaromonas sp.]
MESEAKTIVLISPSMAESNNGNWHTAHRWARFLSSHCDITLAQQWPGKPESSDDFTRHTPQAMIALHARRSAASIQAWAQATPEKPLIVVLTGTDLYGDIRSNADAQQSLALASHIVVLQDAGLQELPEEWRAKTRVIYQSAPPLTPARKSSRRFGVLMVGHLREEKDPLTYMRTASHDFPAGIHFDQIGLALEPRFAEAARTTGLRAPRYRWLEGLPRAATRQHIKRAHVLVNCSNMEGGAQVILEAVQSGTPVLASRISGNIGMLGEDYAGYFSPGDDAQLAALIRRCAAETGFLNLLQRQCRARAYLFEPQEEKRLVINLLASALNEDSPAQRAARI